MHKSKRFLAVALAFVIGAGSFIASAVAQGDNLVVLCYQNRTIKVPFYLMARYTSAGALAGPCPTSP